MKYLPNKIIGALWAIVATFAISCSVNEEDANITEGMAKVNVYLIDAPADYDAVWVEVLGIEILPKGEQEDNGSAWINLTNEASEDRMINLLELSGGASARLGEVEVPAGEISQIRLLLGENNYLLQGDNRIDLTTPSAQQSGLKIKVDKPVQAGISYDLIIDFDAGKSIVRAGNSGQYILKPVLRAVAEESATIEGVVLPLDAYPVNVAAIIGTDTVSTFAADNGRYMLRGLKSGSYKLVFTPNAAFETLELEDIVTSSGEVTELESIELIPIED
ncbi:DUF4382 domain-containing protein [Belliella kenyensis]|uniref:DUF4382 domain-containing protein n=1 Tax=Belliella kenyensis TaxID=1472724 RepID=A0ABV8EPI6_9BACT|nr:DUF4382 domain-containing protein [Belliella kenyensis]MCH7402575.1 DUF4382 domain-containing protein [Belliella kenyensis]MDN3603373.1 DUF4382 domain-containing protein [Belliella kenyensis]